ncbi:MAG: hypothetical protein SGI90_01095 [Candidatus Eisenbacteria bacterium]|nr:hypothetical protein [Candidatus Eisenbacteria bacterium]
MIDVLLTTRLTVSDPTALTALSTLRDRMGFGDRIRGLSREEVFLFSMEPSTPNARDLVEQLARQTNLFMNPNKHAHRITTGEAAQAAVPSESLAWLLVWSSGDGETLEASVHRHVGLPAVDSIRRGWLWKFTPAPGIDPPALLKAARDAAIGDGTHRGFLVHSAWQEGRLYAERPSVYDVREAFLGAGLAAGRRE